MGESGSDHPERPFMVPVATNEQLDQLMDVDPPEPQSILWTPRMEGVGGKERGREGGREREGEGSWSPSPTTSSYIR